MGDPQGDLRPGTPILVGFFTEISKKWVLDSKTPLVEPPTPTPPKKHNITQNIYTHTHFLNTKGKQKKKKKKKKSKRESFSKNILLLDLVGFVLGVVH